MWSLFFISVRVWLHFISILIYFLLIPCQCMLFYCNYLCKLPQILLKKGLHMHTQIHWLVCESFLELSPMPMWPSTPPDLSDSTEAALAFLLLLMSTRHAPQGLCTCCSLRLKCSFPWYSFSFKIFRFLLKCLLFNEAFCPIYLKFQYPNIPCPSSYVTICIRETAEKQ